MVDDTISIGKHTLTRDVKIGSGARIWHFCNLYDCSIGRNTQIGSYCEIKQGAEIGDNCRFQSYIFVPEGTRIGNNVFIGPRVTFLNDKHPTAEKSINKNWSLEVAVVEDEVSIGGCVTILPGVRLGKGSVIGAGAVVTKNVPQYGVVAGVPAKIIGDSRDERFKEYQIK